MLLLLLLVQLRTAAAATADEDDDDEAVACDGDYGMIDDEVDRNDDGDDGLAPGTAVAAECWWVVMVTIRKRSRYRRGEKVEGWKRRRYRRGGGGIRRELIKTG